MTETEKLRALLDERCVEWLEQDDGATIIPAQDGARGAWVVHAWPDDEESCFWLESRHPLTAEHAVDAALGRGECELSAKPSCSVFDWRCDMCGGGQFSTCDEPRYCPSCGARVKEGR